MKLEQWAVSNLSGPYTPPECQIRCISGVVSGSPLFEDGKFITTSRIVSVEGRVVTTNSGSEYTLGDPDPDYVAWCVENGFDPPSEENPIRVL